ncbi:MAG: hypothetical protein EOO11_09095 [Chitinophagaceae bacterium]|nr:MAG: hypothetical protein EOO11_09095 [Chitinophagaceae bacterium]
MKPFYTYTFATFFNAGVSFLVFSLLTHCLSAEDYGVINLYGAFCIFMTPFLGLGMHVMLGVDYFKLDEKGFKNQFVNAMALPVISTIFFTILFALFHQHIERLLHIDFLFTVTFPFCASMILVNDIFLVLLRNKNKHYAFAGMSIAKNLVEVGTTVLLIYFIPLAWRGRVIGSTMALVVGMGIAFYYLRKWRLMDGKFERHKLRENFRIGLPLVPERLAIFVLSFSDRFFIDYFATSKDVGQYSAGAQISVIVRLMIVTLVTTYQPAIMRELAQKTVNYMALRKQNLQFIVISLVTMLGMVVSTPLIFKWFIGKDFQAGQGYAMVLTLSMFFSGLQSLMVSYLLFQKKNKLMMNISFVGVAVSCLLNYFNVQAYGPMGAAYTSLVVYALMAGIVMYYVHRYYGLRQIFLGQPAPAAATPAAVLAEPAEPVAEVK